ncbi:BTB/POZ domain-containing protein SETH6 [Camellia lanceoleosa]|uniref:BTB/POZ domain-containing protein SETH6 n=1 Tax=Camellia lanceoleosa TaxID=1840588 RepID=A0ACC0FEE7_9ERIC|nr:BTB/POZ domain-containing protein SETH6 [Camellia lanceoleosa]
MVMKMPMSDVSSDLTIEVGTSSFALHKDSFAVPSSFSEWKNTKTVVGLEAKDSIVSHINLSAVPGGPEAFELAVKFCYGVNTEITLSNVAMLRCAAHFPEMTEDFAEKNLETQTEVYLTENILPNTSNSISVLHRCESLLPIAEDINLVNRIINAIANSILRIFSIFWNSDEDDDEDNHLRDESEMVYDFDSPGSTKQSSTQKASKLLDNCLAEVALDSNLMPLKFIALAELLPDHARIVNDGLYRAVDIFLKVHQNMKDSERYRLCKTIDCQNYLSRSLQSCSTE